MTKVIGVRFRTAGKIYYFAPGDFEIKRGGHVIVETARGIEYGTVVGDIRLIEDEEVVQPLKPVLRVATEKDDEQEKENKLKEKEAFRVCLSKIQEHNLDMKLIDAEYTFDNNKVLFYFTSDGRVDFRELVKDLASVFRTRIELRQVGVRDETKILGGLGICGRALCCHTYLSEFIPVSIKMAKEQGLSLNPTKISGVCGRLMCCLKHEEETYEELNRRLPNVGDNVTTPEGNRGEVHSVNVLRQKVKVIVTNGDEKEIKEYPVNELQFKKHFRREKLDVSEEELRLLKEMENQDKQDSAENEERSGKHKNKDRGKDINKEKNREKNRGYNNPDNGQEKNQYDKFSKEQDNNSSEIEKSFDETKEIKTSGEEFVEEMLGDISKENENSIKVAASIASELGDNVPEYMNPDSNGDRNNHSFRNKGDRNRKGHFDKYRGDKNHKNNHHNNENRNANNTNETNTNNENSNNLNKENGENNHSNNRENHGEFKKHYNKGFKHKRDFGNKHEDKHGGKYEDRRSGKPNGNSEGNGEG